jgi:MFS family permease
MERTTTAWLALVIGHGALAVGLIFAVRTVPSLLFGLAAGTLADRANRARQLLAVGGAAVPIMGAFGWLVGTGTIHLWHVVAIAFAAGCLQVFDTPARQALVLDTVPREAVPNAVSLNAVAARLFGAFGALGAGVLIPLAGVAHCYLVVAAIYGLTAVLVTAIQVPSTHRVATAHRPFGRALWDAARLIVDVPTVRTLFIASIACEVFAFSHGTVLPVFARDVLTAGPEGLGILNAASAIGPIMAVTLLALVPGQARREPVLGAVFLLYGAAILVLASTRTLALAAAVLVIVGACAGAFDVLQQTLIQVAVPRGQRGRAVGVWVLGLGSAPVGHLEMGTLVATLGAPGALLINGSMVVVSAATLLARAPRYRWGRQVRSWLRSS